MRSNLRGEACGSLRAPALPASRCCTARACHSRTFFTTGYRTPPQAAALVSAPLLDASVETGGLYLGIAAPPGMPAPRVREPLAWRTAESAKKVWDRSAELVRPWASSEALL